jgi:hypothetical protein
VRPKVWLSDRLPAQCTHAEAHQFCLADLIRDAQYAIDHGDTIFALQGEPPILNATRGAVKLHGVSSRPAPLAGG